MFRTILTRFGTGTQNIRRIATTVDQQEIDRFRRLSSRWWSGPEFAPLRSMNQLRVPFISKEFSVSSSLDGIKLLDIGSGGGFLSEALARLGADVTGIDPIEENVQAANEHSSISFGKEPHKRPKYLVSTIEEFCEIPENLNTFDGVIASEVLEHVDNLSLFLDSLSKCLKPNGYFFVTTINQTPVSFFGAIIAAENILGLAPKGTHQYEKFVPPHALNLVLRDYNLETRRIHGMFYNPLTLQWSWTQNQWMNYALVAQKQPSAAPTSAN